MSGVRSLKECSKEDGSWRTHAVAETFAAAAYRNSP